MAATYDVLLIDKGTLANNMVTLIDTAVAAHDAVNGIVRSMFFDPTKGKFVVLIEKP